MEEFEDMGRVILDAFNELRRPSRVKKVIFSGDVTVVILEDGTKGVVRPQNGEPYDREKGLMAALLKAVDPNWQTQVRKAGVEL